MADFPVFELVQPRAKSAGGARRPSTGPPPPMRKWRRCSNHASRLASRGSAARVVASTRLGSPFMEGSLRGRLAGRRHVPWRVQGYLRGKGAIGNRLRQAIGQASLHRQLASPPSCPASGCRLGALQREGGKRRSPPCRTPGPPGRFDSAPAPRRPRQAEHPTAKVRTRHAGRPF
jgi:hypothetical protein